MCTSKLNDNVREYGNVYGMQVYENRELLSMITGLPPEKLDMDLEEFFRDPSVVPGIGEKKRMAMLAVKEIAIRMTKKPDTKCTIIHGPEDVYHFVKPHFMNEMREHFSVLLLNTKNHILGIRDISIGSLTASVVHPREVFKEAMLHSAASLILMHNHPSGDPSPSREDIAVTGRLVKSGKVMDIPVLDHIIFGSECFVSMKEKGLLQP